MKLKPGDAADFIELYLRLLRGIDRMLGILPQHRRATRDNYLTGEERLTLRMAFVREPGLIARYIGQNPDGLSGLDLEIIAGWQNFVLERMVYYRQHRSHGVFLTQDEPIRGYGVLAITETFQEMYPVPPPWNCLVMLLPFRGKVIHDGNLIANEDSIDAETLANYERAYERIKSEGSLITRLDVPRGTQPPRSRPRVSPALKRSRSKGQSRKK